MPCITYHVPRITRRLHADIAHGFPAISAGIYGFPLARATRIALTETIHFLADNAEIEEVRFVCFGTATYCVYLATMEKTRSG